MRSRNRTEWPDRPKPASKDAGLWGYEADIADNAVVSALGLGRVKTAFKDVGPGRKDPSLSQVTIAAINGLPPTMFMTRVRL